MEERKNKDQIVSDIPPNTSCARLRGEKLYTNSFMKRVICKKKIVETIFKSINCLLFLWNLYNK